MEQTELQAKLNALNRRLVQMKMGKEAAFLGDKGTLISDKDRVSTIKMAESVVTNTFKAVSDQIQKAFIYASNAVEDFADATRAATEAKNIAYEARIKEFQLPGLDEQLKEAGDALRKLQEKKPKEQARGLLYTQVSGSVAAREAYLTAWNMGQKPIEEKQLRELELINENLDKLNPQPGFVPELGNGDVLV